MALSKETVALLLTCYNRKKSTLICLKSIYKQNPIEGLQKKIILVDDGSTDGTAESVSKNYPDIHIITGNGNLFWNGGMHLAMKTAMLEGYSYYLWLNDDVKLYPKALSTLYSTYKQLCSKGYQNSIVVGSTQDEKTGETTYGGSVKSSKWHPLRFRLVTPEEKLISCDNFNGNIVFIPDVVVKTVGNLDPEFHHQGGDHDYALRAKKLGSTIWVAPGYLGTCSRNEYKVFWQQPGLSLNERIKKMTNIKALPPHKRKVYMKRHGGFLWPLWWVAPYIKIIFLHFFYNLRS